jgi:FixJ family two-component response regulator
LDNRNKTIAIVDDDPLMLRGVVRLLNAHGFGTQAFASAEAFLDDESGKTPACLVLDINLGGISGIELRRQLRASGSQVPVIFITASEDRVTRQDAAAVGCFAYLGKPFGASQLVDAVTRATA